MRRPLSASCSSCLLLAGLLALAGPAAAQGWRPGGVFAQAGGGEHGTGVDGVGLLWPWAWRGRVAGSEASMQTELFISGWRVRRPEGGRHTDTQLGLVPLLRLRPVQGRSPWFVEGGVGIAYIDDLLVSPGQVFSTRWNFSDNLALGLSLGERRQHEVSLRLQHTSNAGLRHPNPGQNLLLLRYTALF